MSITRTHRAWLFDLCTGAIGSEPGDTPGGLMLNSTGAIAMTEGDQAVHQSLLLLLSTRPGERVMRPDYGCLLHRLLFAPNDANTAGLAIHYVREALHRWESRIAIVNLDAGANLLGDADEAVLHILLDYRVRRSGWENRLAFGYGLYTARLIDPVTHQALLQGDARA